MTSSRSSLPISSLARNRTGRTARATKMLAPLFLLAAALPGRGHADGTPSVEVYGFVRVDGIYDDSRMQHHQFPFWVLSEDGKAGPKDDSRFTLHPRLTRIGLRIPSRPLGERAELRGVVEIDFQNGGRESREILRMRHAYLELTAGRFLFLAGQTWDVVSPLYPAANNDGMMWHAGNIGDRRPQVRAGFSPEIGGATVTIVGAAGMTGAVDAQDLDGTGVLDGQDSAMPHVQGRIGVARNGADGKHFRAGVWGHRGAEETASPVAGETEFDSWAAGFDLSVAFGRRVSFQAEGWTGENLTDLRGGAGQGINETTGREIASRGGWAQIAVEAGGNLSLFGGYCIDDPDDEDLITLEQVEEPEGTLSIPDVGRTRNEAFFFVGRYRPWKEIQFALEYLHWITEYAGLEDGVSNRLDSHVTLYF